MKNRYQSWMDWIKGRWKCPKCKTVWDSMSIFSDCSCVSIEKGRVVRKELFCLKCRFREEYGG